MTKALFWQMKLTDGLPFLPQSDTDLILTSRFFEKTKKCYNLDPVSVRSDTVGFEPER